MKYKLYKVFSRWDIRFKTRLFPLCYLFTFHNAISLWMLPAYDFHPNSGKKLLTTHPRHESYSIRKRYWRQQLSVRAIKELCVSFRKYKPFVNTSIKCHLLRDLANRSISEILVFCHLRRTHYISVIEAEMSVEKRLQSDILSYSIRFWSYSYSTLTRHRGRASQRLRPDDHLSLCIRPDARLVERGLGTPCLHSRQPGHCLIPISIHCCCCCR